MVKNKIINSLLGAAQSDGWGVYESDNEVDFVRSVKSQRTFITPIVLSTREGNEQATDFVRDISDYIDDYDVYEATYSRLDSSGHDKENPERTMLDVLNDVKEHKEMLQDLLCICRKTYQRCGVEIGEGLDFCNDEEKMNDFYELSEDEFLESYSYLTSEEYRATYRIIRSKVLDMAKEELERFKKYATSGSAEEALGFAYEFAIKQEYLYKLENEEFEPYLYGLLIDSKEPLACLYQYWMDLDEDFQDTLMEAVRGAVEHAF